MIRFRARYDKGQGSMVKVFMYCARLVYKQVETIVKSHVMDKAQGHTEK